MGFVASGLGWMFSVSEQMGCKGVGGETRGVLLLFCLFCRGSCG